MRETPAMRGLDFGEVFLAFMGFFLCFFSFWVNFFFFWLIDWVLGGFFVVVFCLVGFLLLLLVWVFKKSFTRVWVTLSQLRNKLYFSFMCFMLSSLYQIRGAILIWCKSQLGVRLWLHVGHLAFFVHKLFKGPYRINMAWSFTNCEKGDSVHELYLM